MVGDLATTRSPHRERVMLLLAIKTGLRAKDMALLTWAMVTDADGQIADAIALQNRASQGKTGGRTMPMHPDVPAALGTLQNAPCRRLGDACGLCRHAPGIPAWR